MTAVRPPPAPPGTGGVLDWINVKSDFGATGTRTADDTAAILAAGTAAAAETTAGISTTPAVYFPSGVYGVKELDWPGTVRMVGDGPNLSQLRYHSSGSGDSSSYVVSTVPTDAYGRGGFHGIGIKGHSLANGTDPIAKNALKLNLSGGPAGADWGFRLEDVHWGWCWGDAVVFPADPIVNLHLDRVRWDTCGGWAISFASTSGYRNPVTISKFTYASGVDATYAASFGAAATAQSRWDGTHFGNGFIYIANATDTYFHLNDARVEFGPLSVFDNRVQAIYVLAGSPKIIGSRFYGVFRQANPGIFVRDKGGNADVYLDGASSIDYGKVYETTRAGSPQWDVGPRGHHRSALFAMTGGAGASNGIYLQGNQIEVRDGAPTAVSRDYKRGDIIFNKNPSIGGPIGWVVTTPTTGFGNPTMPTLTSNAVSTAGSKVIQIVTINDFWQFVVGTAITIHGAGTAGADLDTVITDIDPAALTITVADTIVTGS